jgi:hypothetical protein
MVTAVCSDRLEVVEELRARLLHKNLVQLLSGHVLGEIAAGPIFEYFAKVWRDILANRSFSVRNPVATGPFILGALSKDATNRAKLANLVLASEAAVRAHLSDDLRANIRAMAEPNERRSTRRQLLRGRAHKGGARG